MTPTKTLLAAAAIALSSLISGVALAQTPPSPNSVETASKPDLTDGEIRRIDQETGKLTIRHGEIKHLDMPPMSMVFVVRDKSLLDKVKIGDKIRFMTVVENGQMIVTDLQPNR